MTLRDLWNREQKVNAELAALEPRLKSHAAEAQARRETARQEWVARMLSSGRITSGQVQPLLDVLQSVEEY